MEFLTFFLSCFHRAARPSAFFVCRPGLPLAVMDYVFFVFRQQRTPAHGLFPVEISMIQCFDFRQVVHHASISAVCKVRRVGSIVAKGLRQFQQTYEFLVLLAQVLAGRTPYSPVLCAVLVFASSLELTVSDALHGTPFVDPLARQRAAIELLLAGRQRPQMWRFRWDRRSHHTVGPAARHSCL